MASVLLSDFPPFTSWLNVSLFWYQINISWRINIKFPGDSEVYEGRKILDYASVSEMNFRAQLHRIVSGKKNLGNKLLGDPSVCLKEDICVWMDGRGFCVFPLVLKEGSAMKYWHVGFNITYWSKYLCHLERWHLTLLAHPFQGLCFHLWKVTVLRRRHKTLMLMDFQEDSNTSNSLCWITLSKPFWSYCFVPLFVCPNQQVLWKTEASIEGS